MLFYINYPSIMPKKRTKKIKVLLHHPHNLNFQDEGSIDETLDQRKMRELEEAYDMMIAARDHYREVYAKTFDLVQRGAWLRPGERNVERIQGTRIVPHYKEWSGKLAAKLGFDADDYIENTIRASTEPHRIMRIKIIHSKLQKLKNGDKSFPWASIRS